MAAPAAAISTVLTDLTDTMAAERILSSNPAKGIFAVPWVVLCAYQSDHNDFLNAYSLAGAFH